MQQKLLRFFLDRVPSPIFEDGEESPVSDGPFPNNIVASKDMLPTVTPNDWRRTIIASEVSEYLPMIFDSKNVHVSLCKHSSICQNGWIRISSPVPVEKRTAKAYTNTGCTGRCQLQNEAAPIRAIRQWDGPKIPRRQTGSRFWDKRVSCLCHERCWLNRLRDAEKAFLALDSFAGYGKAYAAQYRVCRPSIFLA